MSEEKIIDRIKKLLSLSQSSNENEAAQAAAMAAELMLKHEIEEAQVVGAGEAPDVIEEVEQESVAVSKQIVHWKGLILAGLAESMGCRMYYGNTYKTGKRQRTYMVAGQESKRQTIKYMYAYLVEEVERLANFAYREEILENKKSKVPKDDWPSARAWKNAFRLGAASTINNRLCEQRRKTHKEADKAGQSQALVVVEKAAEAVEVFMKREVPNLKKGSAASFSSGSGYGAGRAAGKNVGLGGAGKTLGAGAKQIGSGS